MRDKVGQSRHNSVDMTLNMFNALKVKVKMFLC
jgi:hypothetical protein